MVQTGRQIQKIHDAKQYQGITKVENTLEQEVKPHVEGGFPKKHESQKGQIMTGYMTSAFCQTWRERWVHVNPFSTHFSEADLNVLLQS